VMLAMVRERIFKVSPLVLFLVVLRWLMVVFSLPLAAP
jgi:hypothetical protein